MFQIVDVQVAALKAYAKAIVQQVLVTQQGRGLGLGDGEVDVDDKVKASERDLDRRFTDRPRLSTNPFYISLGRPHLYAPTEFLLVCVVLDLAHYISPIRGRFNNDTLKLEVVRAVWVV